MTADAIKAMNGHERTDVYIALLQDIHAQRAELNRMESIVQELQEADGRGIYND